MGCQLCPRQCGADRRQAAGTCGAPDELRVSAVCRHMGEEPPISGDSGIVNVFFTHCSLHCIYCQNGAISGRNVEDSLTPIRDIATLADRIAELLPGSSGLLGLVTAAHYANLLPSLIEEVHRRGCTPVVVYNSSGYERVETLRSLEGLVDIYLPDLKYLDAEMASRYSHAADYPEVAKAALKEMRRQVGSGLKVDGQTAYRGLIVRHLVLPGGVSNSLQCLDWLADEFPVGLHLSLMAQYYPPHPHLPATLDRNVSPEEYGTVAARAEQLGFDGWVQSLQAESHYRPQFHQADNPFEP